MLQGQQSQPAVVCWHWEMLLGCKCLYWEIRSCFVLPVLWLKDSFNAQTSEETVEKTQAREGKKKKLGLFWPYFKEKNILSSSQGYNLGYLLFSVHFQLHLPCMCGVFFQHVGKLSLLQCVTPSCSTCAAKNATGKEITRLKAAISSRLQGRARPRFVTTLRGTQGPSA